VRIQARARGSAVRKTKSPPGLPIAQEEEEAAVAGQKKEEEEEEEGAAETVPPTEVPTEGAGGGDDPPADPPGAGSVESKGLLDTVGSLSPVDEDAGGSPWDETPSGTPPEPPVPEADATPDAALSTGVAEEAKGEEEEERTSPPEDGETERGETPALQTAGEEVDSNPSTFLL